MKPPAPSPVALRLPLLTLLLFAALTCASACSGGSSSAGGGADAHLLCSVDDDCDAGRCVGGFCELLGEGDDTTDGSAPDDGFTGDDRDTADVGGDPTDELCPDGGPANACGGCGELNAELDEPCGECGRLICDPDDDDALFCFERRNACGGCGELNAEPETRCGTCGTWVCNSAGTGTVCEGDQLENSCGGCAELAAEPGMMCGECERGEWVCSADGNSVRCIGDTANACGGCSELEAHPGDPCGACGLDLWLCDSAGSRLVCSGNTINTCGGCALLDQEPGGSCGACGTWTCDSETGTTYCANPDLNACGGCGDLEAAPDSACGTCGEGVWQCTQDRSAVVCSGDTTNACGGCEELSNEIADSCSGCGGLECLYQCGDDGDLVCAESALKDFVLIQPGTFMMGSPEDELGRRSDEAQRETTLTRAFYMQATPVTQGEWRAMTGRNPSISSHCGDDCPVENVTWFDVIAYANALSESEGLAVCYERRASGVIVNTQTGSPYDCVGYRLPTEAEWEYAARAGTTTATYAGDLTDTQCNDTTLLPIAWFCGSASYYNPVAQKEPNDWGLYDMLGNVHEWVWDWYLSTYGRAAIDPDGPSDGRGRVYRGGSWDYSARWSRAASRLGDRPDQRAKYIGFRLARTAP